MTPREELCVYIGEDASGSNNTADKDHPETQTPLSNDLPGESRTQR